MNFAEHHSNLADITLPQALEHIVKLTIAGMATIDPENVQFDEEDDDDETCGETSNEE